MSEKQVKEIAEKIKKRKMLENANKMRTSGHGRNMFPRADPTRSVMSRNV
jgi:hypothetical protein